MSLCTSLFLMGSSNLCELATSFGLCSLIAWLYFSPKCLSWSSRSSSI
jgi:hypothetical protein